MSLSHRKLLSASAIYTLGDLLVMGVSGFLFIPLYVRFMSPAEYGLFATVNTMMTILGVIMMMGLHSAVGRFYFIYNKTGEACAYLGSIWFFQSLVALGIAAVLALWGGPLWQWAAPDVPATPYLWIVLAGALLAFSAGIYPIWLRAQEKPWTFIYVQLFNTSVLAILMVILLIVMKRGVFGALIAGLGASLAMALMTIALLGPRLEWKIKRVFLKGSFTFGGWMMLGTVGYFVMNRSQLFVLQHYSDLAKVGIFNLGLQLSGVIMLVSTSFGKAWQPLIYSSATREAASTTIARTAKYYVASMMYVSLALSILPYEIVHILNRPAYADTASVLRLLSMATFLYTLVALPAAALLYERRAGLNQLVVLGSAILNLLLNILLVPIWQTTGAAWSMIISSTVLVSMSFFLAQRTLRVPYCWADLTKIFGLGCTILLIEGVVTPTLSAPYATVLRLWMLLLYPIGLVALKVWGMEEILSIWKIWMEKLSKRPVFKKN